MPFEGFAKGLAFPIIADLTGLKAGVSEALGELDKTEERFKGLTAGAKNLGLGMTGAGLAIVALTDDAKKTNAEFAGTAITLGTTTEGIRNLALETSDAGFPLRDVTETFDLLARAGVRGDDQIRAISKSMDTLGDATGNSAVTVTSSLIPALNAFDIPLSKVGEHMDGLTYLTKHSTIDLTDFAGTVSTLGPKLNSMGISLEDTEGIMLALADKGYQGAAATRFLRTAFTDATKESDGYSNALDDLKTKSENLQKSQEDLKNTQKSLLQTQKDLTTSTRDTSLSLQENTLSIADAKDQLAEMISKGKDKDETDAQYSRRLEEQRLRIISLGYAHDDLIVKQAELKTKTIENAQARADNTIAQTTNTKAIVDNATAQSDLQIKIGSSTVKETDFYAALGLTKKEVAAYTEKIKGATGDTEKYADAADSAIGTTDKFKNMFDELKLSVGTALAPFDGFGAVLATGGPLILGLTQLPALIGAVNAGLLFMAANPIVLVIAAVAALVLGLAYLETRFGVISNTFKLLGIVFGEVWGVVVETMKWAVNIVIDGINTMIRGLNLLNFSVPDWVPLIGGQSIGFHLSEIPKLSAGAIVTQPTIAMIGESGPEAVVPLTGRNAGGGITITGNTFVVRNDQDIKLVAIELKSLIDRSNRGRGAIT
jgi:TP901 family phage tail tape measure protein